MDRLYIVLYALIIAIIIVILDYAIFSLEETRELYCGYEDYQCFAITNAYKESCTKSLITMEMGNETQLVILQLQIERMWPFRQCKVRELVLEQKGADIAGYNITGYETDCIRDAMGNIISCNGSFYDYLLSSLPNETITALNGLGGVSGSDGGGESGGQTTTPRFQCPLYDDSCKANAAHDIEYCVESKLKVTDLTRGSDPSNLSYWVKEFTVHRSGGNCIIDVEITSAMNLPPYIPLDIIGMKMVCTYSLSSIPKDDIEKEDCTGELVDYFWKV